MVLWFALAYIDVCLQVVVCVLVGLFVCFD